MEKSERNIHHLIDPAITTSKTLMPRHYDGKKLSLDDLLSLHRNSKEKQKLAPVQIYKAGLNVINQYNHPGSSVPHELAVQLSLQNAEAAVKRAGAVKYVFDLVSEILDLPEDHLAIGATNEYLEVSRNTKSRSAIMPTNFKDGAQFTLPHDDHMLEVQADALPKIHIGEHAYFGQNVHLDVGGSLKVGDRVFLARDVHRLGHIHNKDYPGITRQTLAATRIETPIEIGDDVLVGYETDIGPTTHYIGQNTIIGQRSLITQPWIGDFSIVVDNNKTIGYLPVQAYFKAQYPEHVNVETMARIDWDGAIKDEWNHHYRERLLEFRQNGLNEIYRPDKKDKILVIGQTKNTIAIANLIAQGQSVDYVTDDLQDDAFLLQFAQDTNNYKVRVRKGISYFLQNNNSLYDSIIDNTDGVADNDEVSCWIKK